MDPVFAVLLDVARLSTHQPPAIRQTWLEPECRPQPKPVPEAEPKAIREPLGIRWLLSLSLKPR